MESDLCSLVSQAKETEKIRGLIQLEHQASDSEVMNYWTFHPFMHVAVQVTDKKSPQKLIFDSLGQPTIDDKIFDQWFQKQLALAKELENPAEGDLRREILDWPEEQRRTAFENIKHYIVGVFDTRTEFAVSTRTKEIAQKIKVETPAQLRFVLGNIIRLFGGKLIGYNIESYDLTRYSNPRRDPEGLVKKISDPKVKKLCLEPDGLFTLTPDWASANYRGQTWKESFMAAGLELYDFLQVAQNYFGFLTVDRKLETFSRTINFFRHLDFDFNKVMQNYKIMQQYAEKARDGDWQAAYESERYCFEDTEEHLEIALQLIPIFKKVSQHLDLPEEFIIHSAKPQVASRFWDRINVAQEGIPQHQLETKDYELFDLEEFKEKVIRNYFNLKSLPWSWGSHDSVAMFHLPFLIPSLRPLIEKFESLESLTREFYNSEDALERLILAQILEKVLVHPIVDFQKAKEGRIRGDIFEFRYQTSVDDFEKMLSKKSIGMSSQKLDEKLFNGEINLEEFHEKSNSIIPTLDAFANKPIYSLTGHFLFINKAFAGDVLRNRAAIEISSGVLNIEDLVREKKPVFISSGKMIIPSKGQHLMDFGGHLTSLGIGMPGYKKRFSDEYDKREEPMFLTKLKFDFVHASFQGKEQALEVLHNYSQKARHGQLPVENFYITITPRTNPDIYAGSYRIHRRYYRIKHLDLKQDQPQTCLLIKEKQTHEENLVPQEKFNLAQHEIAVDAYLAEAFEEGRFMDLITDAVFFSGLSREYYLQAKGKVKKWYSKDGMPFPTDQGRGQLLLFGPSFEDNLKNKIYLLDRIKFGFALPEEKEEFKSYL